MCSMGQSPGEWRPRPSQPAGCYSWVLTNCTQPQVTHQALCHSTLSPNKRGKLTLPLPHKDDAMLDAPLQEASKALPRCRLEKSCSSGISALICTFKQDCSINSSLFSLVWWFFLFSCSRRLLFSQQPYQKNSKKMSVISLHL